MFPSIMSGSRSQLFNFSKVLKYCVDVRLLVYGGHFEFLFILNFYFSFFYLFFFQIFELDGLEDFSAFNRPSDTADVEVLFYRDCD